MNKSLLFLLIFAFSIRLFPINYPFFTEEEARVAYRGYTLSNYGTDELGRRLPFIFNSLSDYQLPVVSYITSAGISIFGKTDLGARIMFILIGTMIMLLTYKLAFLFASDKKFAFYSAIVVALSPVLIFFSKIPNEFIVLTFSTLLVLLSLTRKRINYFFVLGSIVFSLLTSKLAWFILPPFVTLTVFFFDTNLPKKTKISISVFSFLLSFIIIILFLQIPQSIRSIVENNLYILGDSTLKNGIESLRAQGLESHWPGIIEKLLFNKAWYVLVGILHWLSHFEPGILFGQFDGTGKYGFIGMGAYSKILIVPFILGLILLIKKRLDNKVKALLIFPFILTFPLGFIYPLINQLVIMIILPFLAFICAFGLVSVNKTIRIVIFSLMMLEILLNLFNPLFDAKVSNTYRPSWIKEIVNEGYTTSLNNKVGFSDNITSDIVPFIQWHTPVDIKSGFADIQFPYKFSQTELKNIKIIGSNSIFYNCGIDKPTYIIASERDLKEIKRWLNLTNEKIIRKVYKNNLTEDKAYLLEPTVCINNF